MTEILYRHRKTGGLYILHRVDRITRNYAEGDTVWHRELSDRDIQFRATDTLSGPEFACFYSSMDTLDKHWVRPADMFFDGRFERVVQSD